MCEHTAIISMISHAKKNLLISTWNSISLIMVEFKVENMILLPQSALLLILLDSIFFLSIQFELYLTNDFLQWFGDSNYRIQEFPLYVTALLWKARRFKKFNSKLDELFGSTKEMRLNASIAIQLPLSWKYWPEFFYFSSKYQNWSGFEIV